jgi:predicted dehydrogenase
MGKVHSFALNSVKSVGWPLAITPSMVSISGRDRSSVEMTRDRYGWVESTTDWRTQVSDDRIGLFDNAGPNALHPEPTIAAIRNGKHVLCEKPLAATPGAAAAMLREAERVGVVHMCGFNYRFFPSIRLAREMLESGELGPIRHFRSRFLLGSTASAVQDTDTQSTRGADRGSVFDLGVHHFDLVRYLVGEPLSVVAQLTRRDEADQLGDDAFRALLSCDGNVSASVEASRIAGGHGVHSVLEIDGERGSLTFDLRRLNELVLFRRGRRTVVEVTQPTHPFMQMWWPVGHPLGWHDSFVHQMQHLLSAIAGESTIAPHGATFEDGYRCTLIADAVIRSADGNTAIDIADVMENGLRRDEPAATHTDSRTPPSPTPPRNARLRRA